MASARADEDGRVAFISVVKARFGKSDVRYKMPDDAWLAYASVDEQEAHQRSRPTHGRSAILRRQATSHR
jgi:hypothetical protein